MSNIPLYASVLLRSLLSLEEGEVVLVKDSRADQEPLWAHITPSGEFNTYPLRAFSNIEDFRGFIRYGSAHGK